MVLSSRTFNQNMNSMFRYNKLQNSYLIPVKNMHQIYGLLIFEDALLSNDFHPNITYPVPIVQIRFGFMSKYSYILVYLSEWFSITNLSVNVACEIDAKVILWGKTDNLSSFFELIINNY